VNWQSFSSFQIYRHLQAVSAREEFIIQILARIRTRGKKIKWQQTGVTKIS
jgi:hypothetical protein